MIKYLLYQTESLSFLSLSLFFICFLIADDARNLPTRTMSSAADNKWNFSIRSTQNNTLASFSLHDNINI